jgi:hypothetical protein
LRTSRFCRDPPIGIAPAIDRFDELNAPAGDLIPAYKAASAFESGERLNEKGRI